MYFDEDVERGAELLYNLLTSRNFDPEKIFVISHNDGIQENDSLSIERFTIKKEEK